MMNIKKVSLLVGIALTLACTTARAEDSQAWELYCEGKIEARFSMDKKIGGFVKRMNVNDPKPLEVSHVILTEGSEDVILEAVTKSGSIQLHFFASSPGKYDQVHGYYGHAMLLNENNSTDNVAFPCYKKRIPSSEVRN